MRDLRNKEDVKVFVDAFYQKVRIDPLIGPVFAARISDDDWPKHLERMYSFWNTVLFGEADYRGNPFSRHVDLSINATHFDKWVELLKVTIDNNFTGEKADSVKQKAQRLAMTFQSKLEYLRSV